MRNRLLTIINGVGPSTNWEGFPQEPDLSHFTARSLEANGQFEVT